jgi:hypothetical protein
LLNCLLFLSLVLILLPALISHRVTPFRLRCLFYCTRRIAYCKSRRVDKPPTRGPTRSNRAGSARCPEQPQP